MKQLPFLFLLFFCSALLNNQTELLLNSPVHFSDKKTTLEVANLKAKGFVRYSDFGAKGDGSTDDIDAIVATHAFANEHGLSVKADTGAKYYISGKKRTAVITTNTYFGDAAFIIDDTEVQNGKAPVFLVRSNLKSFTPTGVSSLEKNQKKIAASFPGKCLVIVKDSTLRRFIRLGKNQNKGKAQTDSFIVDKNGSVNIDTPIIWNFDRITSIKALPIDKDTLKITGGHFTTIANQLKTNPFYYNRNISIRRSNILVDRLEHYIVGEGDYGAPYLGFINIRECAYVTVKNTLLTGHKTVSMGSYDILITQGLNISFINCRQTNDINDREYWGIMGSNFCKNLIYENCTLSRFDAHMGVTNATIRNSTLGYPGITAIGSGIFKVVNTTVRGRSFINLRVDYGSSWQGEFFIRDCIFVPYGGKFNKVILFNGANSGQHDFGYACFMPSRITIENLHIDDANHSKKYLGPTVFGNFNPQMTSNSYHEKFPYVLTQEVILNNITSFSGKELRKSENEFMFKKVKLITN